MTIFTRKEFEGAKTCPYCNTVSLDIMQCIMVYCINCKKEFLVSRQGLIEWMPSLACGCLIKAFDEEMYKNYCNAFFDKDSCEMTVQEIIDEK